MVMTDPIADMLTRIRNANSVHHDKVEIPGSKIKEAIATILKDEGFIKDFEVIEDNKQNVIKVSLKYGAKSNFRPQTYFQAWPARIFPERSAAEGSRRPGYRNHLHLSGADDR